MGVDFFAEAVRQAREQARRLGAEADFRIGDLAATGLDAGSADALASELRGDHRIAARAPRARSRRQRRDVRIPP